MPYCEEIDRQTIQDLTVEHVTSNELHPELAEHRELLLEALNRIFASNTLPHRFKSKKALSIATLRHYKSLKTDLTQRYPELDQTLLDEEKTVLCQKLALLFYKDYIEETIHSKLIPYCQENTAPPKWGMGSIFYWDNSWGREFYSFWRNNIESAGKDDLFREIIVSKLPEPWKETYELQEEPQVCPHQWGKMSDEEIVKVLMNLHKKTDPSKEAWGIGSIGASWDDGGEKLWGKSFWSYWRKHVEKEGSEAFEARLLPLFPESWRGNFSMRETRDWQSMSPREIAQLLQSLKRPFDHKKWGLGALSSWIDPSDGTKTGLLFYNAWSHKYRKNALKEFTRLILPKLPAELRDTFMPVGYTIPFHETTESDTNLSESTDDLDELHTLARNGNSVAFKKLCHLIALHFASLGPHIQIPKQMIERIVHIHLPVFGNIIQYASSCLRIYSNSVNRISHSRVNESIRGGHQSSHQQDEEEDSLLENLEIKRLIDHLKRNGISEQTIVEIFDALISGDFSDLTDEHQTALDLLKDLREGRNGN